MERAENFGEENPNVRKFELIATETTPKEADRRRSHTIPAPILNIILRRGVPGGCISPCSVCVMYKTSNPLKRGYGGRVLTLVLPGGWSLALREALFSKAAKEGSKEFLICSL